MSYTTKRLPHLTRGQAFTVEIDGEVVPAYEGETVATVLLSSGRRAFSPVADKGASKCLYCGIGLCHQCLVTVNGVWNLRACMTSVRPGMRIETRPAPTLPEPR